MASFAQLPASALLGPAAIPQAAISIQLRLEPQEGIRVAHVNTVESSHEVLVKLLSLLKGIVLLIPNQLGIGTLQAIRTVMVRRARAPQRTRQSQSQAADKEKDVH
eukprot:TRINITY_DN10344_c0_g1_i2.p1 TRINITY_DN10344_c0_g1~~TRINITY_DN10344_c0_g1_i2.p1  ORF type:complete len:106 (+),score=11.03 TRINITY_DN10344_c0_g1_i2:81-398(+)